jgi:TolB-like protein
LLGALLPGGELLTAARSTLVVLLSLAFALPVGAQCADGSSPPCRQAGTPRAVSIDANRVAVMPFRVATADSLLGEGFAELLAPEFTGEGGPRAIDMSSTLAAWRRAGGGLRSPLSQEDAQRIARQLGAGVLCQGSIVGVGGRLTITASLLDASSGRPIGNPARATGHTDSMEVLLGQIATGLLGAGARSGVAEAGRLTKSPAALRAYFEGLALRRRGHRDAAAAAFEASFSADTMFASAAFQRMLTSLTGAPSPEWERKTVALKERLTPSERTMVNASIEQGVTRTASQRHDARRQAAIRLESPEAWYLYGDNVYHNGLSIVGPDSVLPIARRAFEHALALDSQPISVGHLLAIALRSGDTSLTRRLRPFFDRLEGEDNWASQWLIAGVLVDTAQLARLRRFRPQRPPTQFSGNALLTGLHTPMRTTLLEEAFRHIGLAASPADRDRFAVSLWLMHRARGRPIAAEQSVGTQAPPHWRAQLAGGFWPGVSGDLRDDDAFMREFGTAPLTNAAAESRRQCFAARLTAQRGHADTLDLSALASRTFPRCAHVLGIWKAFATNALTDSALADLDTLVTYGVTSTFLGFEHRLLAQIYEARGDTVRALRAVRLHPRDFPAVWLGPTLREEGRYYLMARDTVSAIRSYRQFLDLRAEAELPFIAERDSIKDLVATLSRRH